MVVSVFMGASLVLYWHKSVPDPGLEIRGEPGPLDPEIRERFPKHFWGPSGLSLV